jgi:Uma2 family endonuclease
MFSYLAPYLFYRDGMKDTLINPVLIIEIVSPSTKNYNRGKKFQRYQGIEILREYAVINSEGEFGIQKFYKNDRGIWKSSFSGSSAEDSVLFQSLDLALSLGEIYENVEMSEE